jgi:hypothetical protein
MASEASKEFFDASVFLGMNSGDEQIRKDCKNFFASRFNRVVLTSLDQVGRCDDVIWGYSRELQDAYYPFMDQLHSVMRILRQEFTEADLNRALDDRRLHGLPIGDRLLLGKVIEAGGYLYTVRPQLTSRQDLPVCKPDHAPEMDFPGDLAGLYRTSLLLRIPMEKLQA